MKMAENGEWMRTITHTEKERETERKKETKNHLFDLIRYIQNSWLALWLDIKLWRVCESTARISREKCFFVADDDTKELAMGRCTYFSITNSTQEPEPHWAPKTICSYILDMRVELNKTILNANWGSKQQRKHTLVPLTHVAYMRREKIRKK